MTPEKSISKGFRMEELLRCYFLKAGYYAVRGVPFVYEGFDVTDVDIWLYGRTSPVSREIIIVDCKNKKTPQALERIFWAKGLADALKASRAIVATTDTRPEVKAFGKQVDILILDGKFLNRLSSAENPLDCRLSEEEFLSKISDYTFSKIDGDWRSRYVRCKALLTQGLSFDSCNEWLMHGHFFAEQAIVRSGQREIALRCFYFICSLISIAVENALKELSFLEHAERAARISEGFTYGSNGIAGMKRILDVSMGLLEQYAPGGNSISRQVRHNVENGFSNLDTHILGEYFAKQEVGRSLFSVGRELEELAMNRGFKNHLEASIEARSLLYCILDFWGIDRIAISNETYPTTNQPDLNL